MMRGMAGRSLARIGVLAAIALAGLAAAVGAFGSPVLPAGWSHISVNVIRKGVPDTLVYDRGVVTAVGANSLTLRESGGTIWVISVAPTALITIGGLPGTLTQVQPKDYATTLAINGAAASTVSVIVRVSAATTTTVTTTTTPKITTTTPKPKPKPKIIRRRATTTTTTTTAKTTTT
jgi:hypothetical protein